MPLYEYRCTGCGERIEVLQRLGEAWLTECPSCHGTLERMISAPALQFKGSGFYITDYARAGADKTADADKTAGADKTTDAAKPGSGEVAAKPRGQEPAKSGASADAGPAPAKKGTPAAK